MEYIVTDDSGRAMGWREGLGLGPWDNCVVGFPNYGAAQRAIQLTDAKRAMARLPIGGYHARKLRDIGVQHNEESRRTMRIARSAGVV